MVRCKKTTSWQYTENICAAVPDHLRVKIAELEKATFFTSECYKFMATVLNNYEEAHMVMEIPDTEVGSDLVCKYA